MQNIVPLRKELRFRRHIAAKPKMLIALLLFLDIFIALLVVPCLLFLNVEQCLQDVDAKLHSQGQDTAPTDHPQRERILKSFESLGKLNEMGLTSNSLVELIVGSTSPKCFNHSILTELITHTDGKVIKTVSARDYVQAFVVKLSSHQTLSLVCEIEREKLPFFVELNKRFKIDFTPNDPYWPVQWAPSKIGAEYAWNYTLGSSDNLVAIIDTGIDYNHPDLAGNYVALGCDWVNNDDDPMDDNGHGTHCAGILAAAINNSKGIAGLSQVKIMTEKAFDREGYGWTDDVVNAIIHAVDQGAKIISNSWGSSEDSILLHQAIKYAYERGVLIVASAGNENTSFKEYPAAYSEVIAVTATDEDDKPAAFTNFGDWVEVAAPGVEILSTYIGNSYARLSGTSMSAPCVAGIAALIWSVFPWMSKDQVRAQLRFTSEDLGVSGFDHYYGYGRLNAQRAVEKPPPESELLILNWQWPEIARPSETIMVTATILNFGKRNESNLEFDIFVNGTSVHRGYIPSLLSGTTYNVESSFTPKSTGIYNLTVYIRPVFDEINVKNNQIMGMLTVRNPEIVEVPEKYRTIQVAINNAYAGDTVKIAAGTYNEHIFIDKSINIVGERGRTVIDGFGKGAVIQVFSCSKVNISGLTMRNGDYGLAFHFSSQNKIINNSIVDNVYGVELFFSQANILKNNRISNNSYNFGVIGESLLDFTHDIDTSNTINDMPIYYLVDERNKQVSNEAGLVVAVNSTNITVANLTLKNNLQGVLFAYTNNSKIENLNLDSHEWGILVVKSFNNTMSNNTISDSKYGIDLWISGNNTLSQNQIISSNDGIYAWRSKENTIINNTVSGNTGKGLWLDQSRLNEVAQNTISQNLDGIVLAWCEKNVLRGNFLNENIRNLGVYGYSLENFLMEIDFSNTINGNPVYYLTNRKNMLLKAPECPAGYIGLINCTGLEIKDLNLTHNGQGILVAYATNTSLENLQARNNDEGIVLISSDGITIKNSSLKGNNYGVIMQNCSNVSVITNDFDSTFIFGIKMQNSTHNFIDGNNITGSFGGISLEFSASNIVSENRVEDNSIGISIRGLSDPNKIYHNNFIRNKVQAKIWVSTNAWDNGYPSGGNYWSDYRDTDSFSGVDQNITGSDGIGDSPYIIDDLNKDKYPLMREWRKTLPMDLNKDGVINMLDLWFVARAFHSKPGDQNWNPNVDLDGNGVINIIDLTLVALQYGKTL